MTITQGIKDLKEYSIPDYDSLEVFELKSMLNKEGMRLRKEKY